MGLRLRVQQESRLGLLVLLVTGFAAAAFPNALLGQRLQLPNANYYQFFDEFYSADYRDAGQGFSRGARTAYQRGTQRFLDSICYWTMLGECHYHMGNYADAITMYEQSLDLYLAYQQQGWQARVQLPPTIQIDNGAANRVRISWGTPGRNATISRMPNTMSVLFGRLDADRVLQEGGVVENAELKSVDIAEIMRCTALALHRRREIKGPTSKYDPFSVKLVNGLSVGNAGNGSVLGAFNGVLLGIAQASMDEWDRAAATLNRSLQLNGGMDHPLTPVALLELANIGVVTKNYAVAGQLALEASYSAAFFNQYDLIEEALGLGTTVHLLQSKTPYPPLEPAIAWAAREKVRLLQASLMVRLADCLCESEQPALAAAVLRQTNGPINSRNSLAQCVVSARLKYVGALVQFQNADFDGGLEALAVALNQFQAGSRWLYQLGLADSLVVSGDITARHADLLYGVLLHDPSDQDWQMDPMEAIAFLASNHVGPMERWFDIVVERKDLDRAINIAELVRRHRFFASLPLGGRLLSFRWVMHAPDEALSQNAINQKRSFLTRKLVYKQLVEKAEQIRTELLALPVQPEDQSPEARQQAQLFNGLAQVSLQQEAMLASLALRREPAELVFPPQSQLSEFRDFIGQDQVALVTLATTTGYHLFFVNSADVRYLGLASLREMERATALLLKKLGLMETAIDVGDLANDDWKEVASELTDQLFAGIPDDAWKEVRELVIVPDGVLWYLPFELLQVGTGDEQKNLYDLVDIRYSPMLFLAYGPQRPARRLTRTGVVTAKMHPRLEPEMSVEAFDQLATKLPGSVKFDRQIRVPSNLLGSLLDQLVVWSEMRQARSGGPLELMPMQLDQAKTGVTLSSWMALPWNGPEHVVMPGFNSDGGTALRSKLNGRDLFLTTTGLMAAGTRTILISRWRMGGSNSLALTENYASRLPTMPGSQALRESIDEAKKLDLNYELEPRIRAKADDPVLKAEHPAFWAANLLLGIPNETPVLVPENPAGEGEPAKDPAQAEQPKPAGDAKPGDAGGVGGNPDPPMPEAGKPADGDAKQEAGKGGDPDPAGQNGEAEGGKTGDPGKADDSR